MIKVLLMYLLMCPTFAVADQYDPTYVIGWGSFGIGPYNFKAPIGILYYNNEVYVCNRDMDRIQVYSVDGIYIRQFGIYGTAPGLLDSPNYLYLYNNLLYISEYGNDRVSIFTPAGSFVSTFGEGHLDQPHAIYISDENIYVVNRALSNVAIFDLDGVYISTFGSYGTANGQFKQPVGITGALGKIYVADTYNNRIQTFELNGTYSSSIPSTFPLGLKNLDGTIYCTKRDGIIRYTYDFQILAEWGCQGNLYNYYFNNPYDISWDGINSLYISDTDNHRVQKWHYLGQGSVPVNQVTWGQLKRRY